MQRHLAVVSCDSLDEILADIAEHEFNLIYLKPVEDSGYYNYYIVFEAFSLNGFHWQIDETYDYWDGIDPEEVHGIVDEYRNKPTNINGDLFGLLENIRYSDKNEGFAEFIRDLYLHKHLIINGEEFRIRKIQRY